MISLYFALFILVSILTSLSVLAAEKHSHSMMLPTTMLHLRNGARFPEDVMLGIQAKEFHLGFSWSAFWQTPSSKL